MTTYSRAAAACALLLSPIFSACGEDPSAAVPMLGAGAGSIMIVGSTSSDAPTAADLWLLKRTWKEMKQMRGW